MKEDLWSRLHELLSRAQSIDVVVDEEYWKSNTVVVRRTVESWGEKQFIHYEAVSRDGLVLEFSHPSDEPEKLTVRFDSLYGCYCGE